MDRKEGNYLIIEMPARWMFMSDDEIRQWKKERRAAEGVPEPETMEELGRRMALGREKRLIDAIAGKEQ